MRGKIVVWCFLIGMMAGCSSMPKYPNSHAINVSVNLTMDDAGSKFSSYKAYASIKRINKGCVSEHLGYVKLAQGENLIGLPVNNTIYFAVELMHGRANVSSTMDRGGVIRAVPGLQYEVDVNYQDAMYDFRLYEVSDSKRKSLPLIPEGACKTS